MRAIIVYMLLRLDQKSSEKEPTTVERMADSPYEGE
jgi:hypothetical protein